MADVSDAEYCRCKAAEARRLAGAADTASLRASFLQIEKSWLEFAEEAERKELEKDPKRATSSPQSRGTQD